MRGWGFRQSRVARRVLRAAPMSKSPAPAPSGPPSHRPAPVPAVARISPVPAPRRAARYWSASAGGIATSAAIGSMVGASTIADGTRPPGENGPEGASTGGIVGASIIEGGACEGADPNVDIGIAAQLRAYSGAQPPGK